MRVAITGSTGLIGSALTHSLLTDGHQVVRLVRDRSARPAGDGSEAAQWDPIGGRVQPGALDTVDAVVHLAGAGVGDKRWSAAYKEEIRRSRALGTRTIARACAESSTPPRVLVSASATGYYGDTGDRTIEESAPPGDDFLAAVCVDWEAAAETAREAGIRVVHPRTGLVVSAKGGAFGRLFPLFRFGLGGRLGSGDQYWPFISLTDHIGALRFAIDDETLTGPVNFTAPEPLTNREITRAMAMAAAAGAARALPSMGVGEDVRPWLILGAAVLAATLVAGWGRVPASSNCFLADAGQPGLVRLRGAWRNSSFAYATSQPLPVTVTQVTWNASHDSGRHATVAPEMAPGESPEGGPTCT